MTEKMVSLILGAGRAIGLAPSADEPSHIHVVRLSQVPQATAADIGAHRSPRPGYAPEERRDSRARLAQAA